MALQHIDTQSAILVSGDISTVKRSDAHVHAFWSSKDGSVIHRPGEKTSWFNLETVAGSGSADPGGLIGVSRAEKHLEVFWTKENTIKAAYKWYDQHEWISWTLGASQGKVARGSPLAATARSGNDMNLFWISDNGSVWTCHYNGSDWSRDAIMVADVGSANVNGALAALWRENSDNHQEIFWTTPDLGIKAAFAYKNSNTFTVWDVASAQSIAPGRDSITAISSYKNRMGIWWITPDKQVKARHWSGNWSETLTVAGSEMQASGAIKAIVRRKGHYDSLYEVVWTRSDRKIGTALQSGWENNHPKSKDGWAVQTLVFKDKISQGTINVIVDKSDQVTFIHASESGGTVCFSRWFQAGTAAAAALTKRIELGEDLTSQLRVNLADYHQVVALSEANINATLKYHFGKRDELMKFEFADNPKGPTVAFDGVLGPPTIKVYDGELKHEMIDPSGSKIIIEKDSGVFFLNFESGTYRKLRLDEETGCWGYKNYDMKGWKLAFRVFFSEEQLDDTPAKLKEKITTPGAYDINQIVIDFSNSANTRFDFEQCDFPGLGGDKTVLAAELGIALTNYLSKLKKENQETVLGYSIKLKSNTVPPVMYPPTAVRPQVIEYRPPPGGRMISGRSAFLFTEMTGHSPLPHEYLPWSGNFFYKSMQGLLVVRRSLFIEKFLMPRLAEYNLATVKLANKMYHQITNIGDTVADKWVLREKETSPPSASEMQFYPIPADQPIQTATEGHVVAKYLWNPDDYDMNKGFLNITDIIVGSRVENQLCYYPGSGWITIESDIIVQATSKTFLAGDKRTVTAKFVTNIELEAANTGKLVVHVRMSVPEIDFQIDFTGLGSGMLPNELAEIISDFIRKSVGDQFKTLDVKLLLEQVLNQQDQSVFPGAGTFIMKDPILNNNGDIMVALRYRLENSEIVPDGLDNN